MSPTDPTVGWPGKRHLVLLLTPQHTGTHFARMLLESHSAIDFCVMESRRVERSLTPNYRLSGHGDGALCPPNECMLDPYAVDFFQGRQPAADFLARLEASKQYHAQWLGRETIYEHICRISKREFTRLGVALGDKVPQYDLFQAHCGPKYAGANFDRPGVHTIVTLRHPLLAVISALRRSSDENVALNILAGFDQVLGLDHARFVCVDLWQQSPGHFFDLFADLGLEPQPATVAFIEEAPAINRTIERGGVPPRPIEEMESADVAPAQLEELRAARALLVREGRVHRALERWHHLVLQAGIYERLQRFGYQPPIPAR